MQGSAHAEGVIEGATRTRRASRLDRTYREVEGAHDAMVSSPRLVAGLLDDLVEAR